MVRSADADSRLRAGRCGACRRPGCAGCCPGRGARGRFRQGESRRRRALSRRPHGGVVGQGQAAQDRRRRGEVPVVPHGRAYALARTALRVVYSRATGERTLRAPTAHEERLLETVRQRVATSPPSSRTYDHTEAKKVESRGVEAVLNALVLTRYDRRSARARGDEATRQAMARLWEVQRPTAPGTGSTSGSTIEANDAVFHGATLAALAAGSESGMAASRDAAGQAGVERLAATAHQRGLAAIVQSCLGAAGGITSPGHAVAGGGGGDPSRPHRRAAARRRLGDRRLGPWRWTRARRRLRRRHGRPSCSGVGRLATGLVCMR